MGKLDLFLPNGYINMHDLIFKTPTAFVIIADARGTGKTEGSVVSLIEEEETPFIYIRRTQTQHEIIASERFSMMNNINKRLGWDIHPFRANKLMCEWYTATYDEDDRMRPSGNVKFVSTSLTAMHSVRGFNGLEFKYLVYDEFIPGLSEKKMKGEDDTFFNAVETINRNRELEGCPPLKVILCSNSNQLDNPIFSGLGIVEKAETMKRKGQMISIMKDREITLVLPHGSKISEQKKNTALYKATQNERFKKMALENDFAYDTPTKVQSLNFNKLSIMAEICGMYLYDVPYNDSYYISSHKTGTPQDVIEDNPADRMRFKHDYVFLIKAYRNRQVIFESYSLEIKFKRMFRIDN